MTKIKLNAVAQPRTKTATTTRKKNKAEQEDEIKMIELPPGFGMVAASMIVRAKRAKTVGTLIRCLGGPLIMGKQLKIDHSSISQWSQANRVPSNRLAAISKLFGLPMSSLRKFESKNKT